MRELLAELISVIQQVKPCVYCAVIETRGSTPQKAGAAMLVFPDGSQRGTLGGGCVEAEVKQRALRLLVNETPTSDVMTFNLDDNYGWDDGLICGGRMSILADPISGARRSEAGEYYRRFHELVAAGAGCTEAIIMDEKSAGISAGSRYLFSPMNDLVSSIGSAVNGEVAKQLTPLRNRPRPFVKHGIAYLPVLPRVTLLIVGGGHVGQAVAQLAADVDFDIWVVDDREAFVSRARFPTAQRLIVGDIGMTLKEIRPQLDASTFALIVTRGHAHDEEALFHLADTPAGYVGMIGSKRKIKLIYEDLIARGISTDALAKVHAPLGFSIGSQTVPEIAVSIVAELIACRNLGATIPEARVWVKPGKKS